MEVPKDKFILDPCCGGRLFWFNKNHPNVIYTDIREEEPGFIDNRPNREVKPDHIMDFRELEFPDESFRLVVWDPPHLRGRELVTRMHKTYGALLPETWQSDLKRGFKECMRVLMPYGVLVFKWNDSDIAYKKVLRAIGEKPLFHNTITKSKSVSYWACFMKIPKGEEL